MWRIDYFFFFGVHNFFSWYIEYIALNIYAVLCEFVLYIDRLILVINLWQIFLLEYYKSLCTKIFELTLNPVLKLHIIEKKNVHLYVILKHFLFLICITCNENISNGKMMWWILPSLVLLFYTTPYLAHPYLSHSLSLTHTERNQFNRRILS